MSPRAAGQTVRIIGGNWRGRKVSFARHEDIRPTPSRIRETLFNWLREKIHGAQCLELYAGSGILSIEALSRGAAHVTLCDRSRQVMAHIRGQLAMLCPEADRYTCLATTARDFLAAPGGGCFDVVFLDPPFASDELGAAARLLETSGLLCPDALIYMESGNPVALSSLPAGWHMHRQKRAGQVHYCLVQRRHPDAD